MLMDHAMTCAITLFASARTSESRWGELETHKLGDSKKHKETWFIKVLELRKGYLKQR